MTTDTPAPASVPEDVQEFIDFPLAWKMTLATDKSNHHEKCSYRVAGMLCDCAGIQMAGIAYDACIEAHAAAARKAAP